MILIYIIAANLIIGLFSLTGILILTKNEALSRKLVFMLVGLSTGTLLGGAFFHLLPEALETSEPTQVLNLTLLSFIVFFVIEKILHWHHCHDGECSNHTIGHMNLLGDSIHNLLDGIIIAGSFLTDIRLGIITSIALVFHEIPQELGDFGVLMHAGFKKGKAIILNLLISFTAIFGGLVGFYFFNRVENVLSTLLPIAAGGFLYIATSDLIPELKKEPSLKTSIYSFILLIMGIALMFAVTLLEA